MDDVVEVLFYVVVFDEGGSFYSCGVEVLCDYNLESERMFISVKNIIDLSA